MGLGIPSNGTASSTSAGREQNPMPTRRAGFGCPVTPIDFLRDKFKEIEKVRELLALGMARLNDAFGLDWWELTSILVHHELESIILLRKFVETLGAHDEVHLTRPCFHAEVLRLALGSRLHTFPWRENQHQRGARHYLQVLRKFPVGQLLEIFWDKKDSGYQIRGSFGGKRKPSSDPVVLLPSAYVNASSHRDRLCRKPSAKPAS